MDEGVALEERNGQTHPILPQEKGNLVVLPGDGCPPLAPFISSPVGPPCHDS